VTTSERKLVSSKLQKLESLNIEIAVYESAISDAESLGKGNLPHVELLRKTLKEMKDRLQVLKQT
jgi:ferritin-like metal-binding protein YciE